MGFFEKNKKNDLTERIFSLTVGIFLFFIVFVSFFLMFYFKEFLIGGLFLLTVLFLFFCLYLLKKGYVFKSVFLLTFFFSVFFVLGEIIILQKNNLLIFYLAGRFGILITVFLPLIIFGLKNKKYLIYSTFVPLFLFLTFDVWLSLFVPEENLHFLFENNQRWLINLGFFLLLTLNYLLIYALQKTNSDYEKKLLEQNKKIEEINEKFDASIKCANRIQEALLKDENLLSENFSDYFILFRPKDVVSGDFYWIKEKNGKIYIVLGDCTGHGVPGAFLTLLSISILNIIDLNTVPTPADILEFLRTEFKKLFYKKDLKFGLDATAVMIDISKNVILFSGAHQFLLLLDRYKKAVKYKGISNTVGLNMVEIPFLNTKINFGKGDIIYLFSDGYADQLNDKRQKIGNTRFRKLLIENSLLPMKEQKRILEDFFEKWKGSCQQIDDVLVIGIKL